MPDNNRWLTPQYNGLVWRMELHQVPDVFNEDILWSHEHIGQTGKDVIETISQSNDRRLKQALERHRRWAPGRTKRNGRVEEVWHYFTDVILCISQQQWDNEQVENSGAKIRALIQNLVSKHKTDFPNLRTPRYSVRPDHKLKNDQVVFFFGKGVYLPAPKETPICNVLPALNGVLAPTIMVKIWELPIPQPGPQPLWWHTSAPASDPDISKPGALKVLDQPAMFYEQQDCFLCTPEGHGPLPIPGWQASADAFLLIRKDGDDNWVTICDNNGNAENCPPAPGEKKWVFRRMPKPLEPTTKAIAAQEPVLSPANTQTKPTPDQVQIDQTTADKQSDVQLADQPPPIPTASNSPTTDEKPVDQLLSLELTQGAITPPHTKDEGKTSIISRTIIAIRNVIHPVRQQQPQATSPYTIELEGINLPNLVPGLDQLTIYLTPTGGLATPMQIKCALRDKIGLNRFISVRHNNEVSISLAIFGGLPTQWQYAINQKYDIGTTGASLLPPIAPGQSAILKFSNSVAYTYPINTEPRTLGRTDPADPANSPEIALDQLAQPWSLFGAGQVIYDTTTANLCLSRHHAKVWIKDECLIAEPVKSGEKYKDVILLHLDANNKIKPTTTMPLRLEDGDGLMAGYALLRYRVQK